MPSINLCPRCAGPVRIGDITCSLCGTSLAKASSQPPPARRKPPDKSHDAAKRMDGSVKRAPNCYQCAYFQITHQRGKSRACTMFGFKSDELPAYVLYKVSGIHCMKFKDKDDLGTH